MNETEKKMEKIKKMIMEKEEKIEKIEKDIMDLTRDYGSLAVYLTLKNKEDE